MPRPRSTAANPFRGRYTQETATAKDRAIARMGYRLQREQEGTWVTLRGHDTLEPLLAKAWELLGSVRIIDKRGREVVRWQDGERRQP